MKFYLMTAVAAVAFGAGAMVAPQSLQAAEAPPIGGGYTNVIPIPVNDPSVKEIAGALFQASGRGTVPGGSLYAPLWRAELSR
jgi:hypothetical protein